MRVKPERVRVAVRKGTAPAVGSFVAFKAHLSPPLQPLRPGGYDFARDMYFQRIGASGFVLGAIRTLAAAAGAKLAAALRRASRRLTRSHQPAHPHHPARRPRLHRLGADHRQTQRHLGAGQRRLLRLKPRPCAGDLRLPHGGGGRHRLLRHPRTAGAVAIACQPPPDQEMGRGRRAGDRRVLSAAVGHRRLDPARLHHDRHRAHRRDARPAGADLPHAGGRGLRRAAVYAASGGAPELPDVVCGDAGADRRLSIRLALARRCRHLGGRARGAVGLAGDRRRGAGLAGRRARHHALRRLPLPSPGALWRARQSAGHAGGLGLGDAHGHPRRGGAAVRLRRAVLAADGAWHRLDDLGGAVGGASAGRGRPHSRFRHRAAAAGEPVAAAAVPAAHAVALERGAAGRRGRAMGSDDAAARYPGLGRRLQRGVARARWTTVPPA